MKKSADVVIVGGGCMGASTAFHLAKLGIRNVVLIEREPLLGSGSTGRNAGGVRHQFSHEANVRLSIESIHLFERFQEDVGYEVDFHQDGYLFLLSSEQSVSGFRRNMEMQRRMGIEVDWLEPPDAAHLAPGLSVDGVVGATYCARDGIVDPNGVTMGFVRGAAQNGVEVVRETEVTGIPIRAGQIEGVRTTKGDISTPVVVNAAGPYARQVGEMAGVNVPVDPFRRHIFIAVPPAGTTWNQPAPGTRAAPLVPQSHIMVIDFETTFYFHREGANMLFGMADPEDAPGFDTTVNWEFLERVTPVAVRRLPALADAAVSHAWAGLYEITPDAMPIIGPVSDVKGFFLINGFSGHGFQHSPAAGRILADLIAGRDPGFDLSPFEFARFQRADLTREGYVV
jgi:sarcosine oxidase subunit beta